MKENNIKISVQTLDGHALLEENIAEWSSGGSNVIDSVSAHIAFTQVKPHFDSQLSKNRAQLRRNQPLLFKTHKRHSRSLSLFISFSHTHSHTLNRLWSLRCLEVVVSLLAAEDRHRDNDDEDYYQNEGCTNPSTNIQLCKTLRSHSLDWMKHAIKTCLC